MSASWMCIFGLMITSSWLFVGCSSAKGIDVGGACILNSDCNTALVCTAGKCHDACHISADCPLGQSCIIAADQSTVCQLPIETKCADNGDCKTPLTCAADLRCRNQCQRDADCLTGQVCATTGTCAEPNQVDSTRNLFAPDGGVSGCQVGTETCSCYPNDTCNAGLTCASHLCVNIGTSGIDDVAPRNLAYSTNPATYSKGVAVAANAPTSSGGPVVSYSVSPALPAGLSLDSSTGVITGTPTAWVDLSIYIVTATNSGGSSSASVSIAVGRITTVANIPSPAWGVAVDGARNLYIGYNSSQLLKVTPAGVQTTLSTAHSVNSVAVDQAQNIYYTDYYGGTAYKLAPDGTETTLAVGLNGCRGIAVDLAGNIYIGDAGNSRVLELTPGGTKQIVGTGFSRPEGVAVDNTGNLYVADSVGNQVVKVPADGGAQVTVGTGLSGPTGVAVDLVGNVYIAASGASQLVEVQAGGVQSVLPSTGEPIELALDGTDTLYFADYGGYSVYELQ
jgi:streptogramin lyase